MRFECDSNNFSESYQEAWGRMSTGMKDISSELHVKLVKKCQENLWLKKGGIPFEDDPYFELDSPYSFSEIDDIEILEMFFDHGNWSIRNGVVYKDLVFINQVNGGDEWWTLKKDGDTYLAFESVTFRSMIKCGEFTNYIERLLQATLEQCRNLEY